MDVEHVDAEAVERVEEGDDPGPVRSELFALGCDPLLHDVFGKLLGVVELSGREVEEEGGLNDGHLDDGERVVRVQDLWDVMAEERVDVVGCEAGVDAKFLVIGIGPLKDLDRG